MSSLPFSHFFTSFFFNTIFLYFALFPLYFPSLFRFIFGLSRPHFLTSLFLPFPSYRSFFIWNFPPRLPLVILILSANVSLRVVFLVCSPAKRLCKVVKFRERYTHLLEVLVGGDALLFVAKTYSYWEWTFATDSSESLIKSSSIDNDSDSDLTNTSEQTQRFAE
jgi:hypothetical protein